MFLKASIRLIVILTASVGNTHQYAQETSPIKGEPYQAEEIHIEDRFNTDTRNDYKINGDVEWSDLEVTIKKNGFLGKFQRLDAKFRYELDLWPKQPTPGKKSLSRINIALTNNWELVIAIYRGNLKGRFLTQVVVSELDGRDQSLKKPKFNELRRFPPIEIDSEVERWVLDYHYGIINLSCNDKKLGSTYSDAFGSWCNAIAISQLDGEVSVSRLLLTGKTAGYSEEQNEIYLRIRELREQSKKVHYQGDLHQAIDLEEEALSANTEIFGKDDVFNGLMHQRIGELLNLLGMHEQSREKYNESVKTYEEVLGANHPNTLQALMLEAEQHALCENYDEGEIIIRKVAKIYEKNVGIQNEKYQNLLNRMVYFYSLQAENHLYENSFETARNYQRERLRILGLIREKEQWLVDRIKTDINFLNRVINANDEERKRIIEYLKLQTEIRELNVKGTQESLLPKGRSLIAKSRELFENSHIYLAENLSFVGSLEFDRGNFREALGLYSESNSIYRKLAAENDIRQIDSRINMGTILSRLGRFQEAEPILNNACYILGEEKESSINFAYAMYELGNHFIRTGNFDKALELLVAAARRYRALGLSSHPHALKMYSHMADLSRLNGNKNGAEKITEYLKQLVENTSGPNSVQYIDVLTSEAKQLHMEKKYPEAIEKYNQAIELIKANFSLRSQTYAEVVEGLIGVYLDSKDFPSAVKSFEERLRYEHNRRTSLFNAYSEELQLAQSLADRSSLSTLIQLAVAGHIEPEKAYNHALLIKSAVTTKQRSMRLAASHEDLQPLLDRLQETDASLASSRFQLSYATSQERHQQMLQERQQLNAELASKSKQFLVDSNPTTSGQLQQAIPSDVVLFDYYEYEMPNTSFWSRLFNRDAPIGLVAFVVTKEQEVKLIDLGPYKPIHQAWLDWYLAIPAEIYMPIKAGQPTPAEKIDALGIELRKLIWDPLSNHTDGAKQIIYSPAACLFSCPFGALPDKKQDTFLIESKAFSSITTMQLVPEFLDRKNRVKDPRLLIVSDIDFNSQTSSTSRRVTSLTKKPFQAFKKLPSSQQALKPVITAFLQQHSNGEITKLFGRKAQEDLVRESMVGAQYLHFNTHGFCLPARVFESHSRSQKRKKDTQPSPAVSGIALAGANRGIASNSKSNGIIWSNEISSLNLRNAELVTLSACESALGDVFPGEGMFGCQRALHIAGAQSSLTTLWSIYDDSSNDLATLFYQGIWRDNLSKAEALQTAMTHMLRNYRWKKDQAEEPSKNHRTPPVYWAGFVLDGNWQ